MRSPNIFPSKPWPATGAPVASEGRRSDVATGAIKSVVCTSCHLEQFQGDSSVPRLAGQQRDYLAQDDDGLPQSHARQQSGHVRPHEHGRAGAADGARGLPGWIVMQEMPATSSGSSASPEFQPIRHALHPALSTDQRTRFRAGAAATSSDRPRRALTRLGIAPQGSSTFASRSRPSLRAMPAAVSPRSSFRSRCAPRSTRSLSVASTSSTPALASWPAAHIKAVRPWP